MTDRNDPGEALITETEAAAMLRVARITLARWRRAGRAPRSIRLGRNVRYKRRDVEAFVAAGRAEVRDACEARR